MDEQNAAITPTPQHSLSDDAIQDMAHAVGVTFLQGIRVAVKEQQGAAIIMEGGKAKMGSDRVDINVRIDQPDLNTVLAMVSQYLVSRRRHDSLPEYP